MLKEYSISDILSTTENVPYFVGTFEDTDDPDIEWAHRHSFYSLVWFTQGKGFYVIDFKEYEIKPQRLFLVNTKQIHNWDYSSNSKGYILMLDAVVGAELGINTIAPFAEIRDTYISILKNCFVHLIHEFEVKDDSSDTNIKIGVQYLYSIVRRNLAPQIINNTQSTPLIDKFRMLVIEHPNFLFIGQYAESLKISEDELNRICKEYIGISPKQYILDLKITEAKRLLLFGTSNVNGIAFQLGFGDSSYFSRIFKKKTSLSPTDFLEKYRKQK